MRARTIAKGISRLCETATALILVIVCIINLTQVIGRYLVGYSLPWGEEVMRYVMMWLMMLGSVSCLYRCEHMAVDGVVNSVPESRRNLVRGILYGIAGVFCGLLIFYGWPAALENAHQRAAASGIPMILPYLAIPVGGTLMLVEIVLCWFGGYQPIDPTEQEGW